MGSLTPDFEPRELVEIIAAARNYREACSRIKPLFKELVKSKVDSPERLVARQRYNDARIRIIDTREVLLQAGAGVPKECKDWEVGG